MPGERTYDLNTLPKWAQLEIRRLRADLRDAEQRLAHGPESSTVIAEPYGAPVYLGDDPHVQFKMQRGSLRVQRVSGSLDIIEVSSDEAGVEISPVSSNVVRVRVGGWWRG